MNQLVIYRECLKPCLKIKVLAKAINFNTYPHGDVQPLFLCYKDEGVITGYQREIGDGWVLYNQD